VGGHAILMFNGWLVTVINWILLVIVLIEFTPAVFTPNGVAGVNYVLCYLLVVIHFIATSWLSVSMVIRSFYCPQKMSPKTAEEQGYLQ